MVSGTDTRRFRHIATSSLSIMTSEIWNIEALHPHIRDISFSTYYRLRKAAVEALSYVLWGFSAQDTLKTLDCFFPPDV